MKQNKGGAHGAKKKRNKAYRPYQSKLGANLGGVATLLSRQDQEERLSDFLANSDKTYTEDSIAGRARAYWAAFVQLKMADATLDAWSTVCSVLNVAVLLTEFGIGEAEQPLIIRALDGIFKARLRGERTGSYRLDGDGLAAVSEALLVHDEQMKLATPMDMLRADHVMHQRISAGQVYTQPQLH